MSHIDTPSRSHGANYAERVWCHCRTGGVGEHGCTDCLNTGLDSMAMAAGIEQALNDAYAEGRKDEREEWIDITSKNKDLGGAPLTQAAHDLLAERQRQVTAEGWSPRHDDAHTEGSLAMAASCYALNAATWAAHGSWVPRGGGNYRALSPVSQRWPWRESWWKPSSQRRDLVKAGALILAEIERLDRARDRDPGGANPEGMSAEGIEPGAAGTRPDPISSHMRDHP